jgi:uncharacterized repeat protein (TIGR01451 family)/fimbrial isopeptide formation D2 family protein
MRNLAKAIVQRRPAVDDYRRRPRKFASALRLERLEDRTLPAPVPTAILNAPASPLLGTDIPLSVAFTNSGDATGYGPYVDVILPGIDGNDADPLTYNPGSATYLGAPVSEVIVPFNAAGQATHPFAEDTSANPVIVTGPPNGELVVFRLPFGSFTVGQPAANINFTAHVNNHDDLNTPIPVETAGGFQFGADPLNNPTVDPSICVQNFPSVPVDTVPVTPILFTVNKVYLGPEQETATGPNFKHQYEIDVSVAPGQTINTFQVADTLPNNMQFVSLDVETANGGAFQGSTLPSVTTPGGMLLVNFDKIVGTGGATDAKVVFTFFIPRDDASGAQVLPLANGNFATSTNNASANGTWNPIDPNDPQNEPVSRAATPNTITDKSIAIQKGVQDLTNPGAPIPGDTLSYALNFQISDFFGFQGVTVVDTISDGQDFDPAETGFTPTIQFTQQGQTIPASLFGATNFSFITNADGTITVTFNVSQEVADLGLTTGGKLLGASVTAPNGTGGPEPAANAPPPGTTGTIVFHTLIRNSYRVLDTNSGKVVQGDVMSDDVNISGTVLNFSDLSSTGITQTDDSSASVTLPRGTLAKSIYAVDGVTPPNPNNPALLRPNGTVTYEITYSLPASSVDQLQISDFLPLPVLPVPGTLTFDGPTGAAIPAIDHFSLGVNDSFHLLPGAPTPTVTMDVAANSLTFDFGNYKDDQNQPSTIDLLFTVQASSTPFADGLFLTNQAHDSESSEDGGSATEDAIVMIKLTQPLLVITKGVVSTDDPAGVFTPPVVGPVTFAQPGVAGPSFTGTVTSAGLLATPIQSSLSFIQGSDLVKFAIVIENIGQGIDGAFDVSFKDALPAGFEIPPAGQGLNLSVTDGTGLAISTIDLGGGFFGNGLELVDPGPTMGALSAGKDSAGNIVETGQNIAVITFDLEALPTDTPLETATNTATLTNYANTPGGPNFIPNGLTASANVTIASPAAEKTLVGTSIVNANNANNQAVIGETATYQIVVTIPQGVTPAAQIVDSLPAGLAFVKVDSVTNTPFISFTGNPSNPTLANSGQTVTFAFGDITNSQINLARPQTITIDYDVVVLNVSTNVNGTTLANSAQFSWTGNTLNPVSAAPITVIEPKLQVSKSVLPAQGEAGTTVTFTIVVSHAAARKTDAQNVVLTDTIPAGLNFVVGSLTNTAGVVPTSLMIAGNTITATYSTLLLGSTSTLQFQATLAATVNAGQMITNNVSETWTSLPGGDPGQITPNNPNAFERTGDPNHGGQLNNYMANSSATVTVFSPTPAKTLLGTSIVNANNAANQTVIGELVDYQLSVTVPQGVTPAAQFVDTLPAGLAFVMVNSVTNSDPVHLSFTGNPGNPTLAKNGQKVTFPFGDITDTDTDHVPDETITIDYEVVVLNVSTNINGKTLTNSAQFSWTGNTLAPVSAAPVTVIEPKLQVSKSVLPAQGEAGTTVTFTIVVSHTAASKTDAQSVVVTDTVPTGLNFVAGSLANTAGVVPTSLMIAGNTITATYSTLLLGSTSTLQFQATLAANVNAGQKITNNVSETWTSLPGGDPGQITPNNPNAFERTGDPNHGGQLNNYTSGSSATVTVFSPTAVKTLLGTSIVNGNNAANQAVIGELVDYQLTVTLPQGVTPAAQFVDTLPAGLAFVMVNSVTNSDPVHLSFTGDPSNPTVANNGQLVTFSFGDITNTDTDHLGDETITIDYETVVLNVSSNVNGATLTNSAVFSWTGNTLQTLSAAPVTVIEPKLDVNKSVTMGAAGANPGNPIQYTIVLQQDPNSATDAFNTTFSDPLPTGAGGASLILSPIFTVVDSAGVVTAANFQLTGSDATGWTLSTTPAGAFTMPHTAGHTITITISGTLSNAVTPGQIIPNTASSQWTSLANNPGQITPNSPNSVERTGNSNDPGQLNNYDAQGNANFHVNSADLMVVKTVSNVTPNVGDTITFTVTLTNNGPDTATNVTINDLLPSGLTFVGANPSVGAYDNTSGVWTVGTILNQAIDTLQIMAMVVSQNAQTNTATVGHSDELDPNPNNNTGSASVTPQQADLAIVKTVSDMTPNVGDTVTFTVTLSNLGPDTATNVTVTDPLPAGLTLVQATPSQGTYVAGTGVWTVGTVTTTTPLTLVIMATVVSPNAETNTATITHSDQFDPNPNNNTNSATVTPQQADLAIVKTVSNMTPNVGDTITFTVTLSNLGPDTATNVTVADPLPAGLTLVQATPSQGTYVPGTGVWTVGTVTTTTPLTLVIMATVLSPSSQTNTATVTHSDQFDPNPNNNTSSVTLNTQQADLGVVKTVSNATPNVGDTITFTVTLSNAGPNTATNVTVGDLLPAGLQFVSATPSEGTYDAATGVWTVGTVPTSPNQTLVIMANVVTPAVMTNTATITHSDQFDPNPGNNTSSTTQTPQQADLGVLKTVSDTTPNVGDTITFTITLSNAGPKTATNVTVGDLLPAGLQFVSATPSEGTYSAATGVWTVGTVPTSPNQTLVVMAKVVSPAVTTNTASITHSDQFDPNPGNNTSSTTQTPQQADLGVLKTVNNSNPNVGDDIVFTIVLTNRGPDTATNVTLLDPLPSGLVFVSSAPQQGAYSSGTGIWTVGTVPNGANLTLTITAQIVSGAPQTNTVSVNHSDQFDPNPGNNQSSVTVGSNVADLILTKVVSNNQVIMGFNTIFTLTVSNLGPSPAVGVVVDDPLPAGLFFIGVQAITQGTYDPSTGVWTLGSLAVGQTASIQLVTQILVTGPIVNTATVSTTTPDSDASNNVSSSSVIGLLPPDLISKRPFLANDPPFTVTGQLYIAHLYRDLLGREADADGLAGWGLFLAQGGTRTQMVTGFENSSEYQGREVVGLYEEYLHRVPAAPEVAGWVNRMSAGLTFEQVQNQFAGSQEFFQVQGGGTIAGFLNALYADALGRAVDAVGAAGWNQAFANGASPAAVATAVLRSAEADRDAVEAIYAKFLHRTADAPGLAIWTGELEAGAGEGAVLARILASEEYFLRP